MFSSRPLTRTVPFVFLLLVGASIANLYTTDRLPRRPIFKEYGKMPLVFEANRGQAPEQVRFLSRTEGYTVFLTDSEAVMVLPEPPIATKPLSSLRPQETYAVKPSESAVLRMRIDGASHNPEVSALDEVRGHGNYFIGNDPKKWVSNAPLFKKVRFSSLYPGVDLEYYGTQATLEYDFFVAPGADPGQIRLAVEGSNELSIDKAGDLVARVQGGEIRLARPRIYQVFASNKEMVAGEYRFTDTNQVGFQIGDYDHGRPLIIDPQLSYSTFLGGSDYDTGINIAVDKDSYAYITGTAGVGFPTTSGAYSQTIKSSFVTKVSADGSNLVYSTYFGSSSDTMAKGIAVNAVGEAFLVGSTRGSDFPTTANAFQKQCGMDAYSNCTGDAFVAKLSADGSTLLYSSYLGGSGEEQGYGIAVDSSGNAYAHGATWSSDFPTTTGAYQEHKRGFSDVFVAKVNPSAATPQQSLVYSTCIGGTGNNADQYDYSPHNIAVDAAGSVYLAGGTLATDFPTTSGAFQTTAPGDGDAFVVKLNPQGSGLVYSTYLGGSDSADHANSIAIDSTGNAYVAGVTWSSTFPVTPGSLYDHWAGTGGFVTKLNPSGSALVYSTFFPNVNQLTGITSIALDASNNVLFTGIASNPGADSFQLASPIQDKCGMMPPPATFCSDDAFVAKLNAAGNALIFSTLLGGSNNETATGIAVDSAGDAYVAGRTYSFDFPAVNPYQSACVPSYNGACADVFVSKLSGLKLPVFTGLPRDLNFNPPVGTKGTQSLTISNLGDASLTFSSVTLAGTGFSLTNNACTAGGALNPGESCGLTVAFTSPDTNPYSGTLTISDNAYRSPHQVSLFGTGSDYVMGALPSQATIVAGQSATFGVGAQPINSFNQAISLTCNGAPPESVCQLGTSTLPMDGINIVGTTVTISTTARNAASAQRSKSLTGGWPTSLAMMLFAGVLLVGNIGSGGRFRKFLGGTALIVWMVALIWLCGCASNTPPQIRGTPAGTYTIIVTASSSGLQHSTTLQLTVN